MRSHGRGGPSSPRRRGPRLTLPPPHRRRHARRKRRDRRPRRWPWPWRGFCGGTAPLRCHTPPPQLQRQAPSPRSAPLSSPVARLAPPCKAVGERVGEVKWRQAGGGRRRRPPPPPPPHLRRRHRRAWRWGWGCCWCRRRVKWCPHGARGSAWAAAGAAGVAATAVEAAAAVVGAVGVGVDMAATPGVAQAQLAEGIASMAGAGSPAAAASGGNAKATATREGKWPLKANLLLCPVRSLTSFV